MRDKYYYKIMTLLRSVVEIVILNGGFIQIIKYLMGFLQERLESIIDNIFNPVEITLLFYIIFSILYHQISPLKNNNKQFPV